MICTNRGGVSKTKKSLQENFDTRLKLFYKNYALQIMRIALHAKFTQNSRLREALISTYPHPLSEIAKTKKDYWAHDIGKNKLGELLMELRLKLIILDEEKLYKENPQEPSKIFKKIDKYPSLSFYQGHMNGYKTITIAKDSIVYHGYRRESLRKRAFLEPMWFGDSKIATVYGEITKGKNNCYRYRINKDITLIRIDDGNTIRKLQDEGTEYDNEIIKLARSGKTNDLYRKLQEKGTYPNMELAKLVCRLGFDGWYEKGDLKEILICEPATVVTEIGKGCD